MICIFHIFYLKDEKIASLKPGNVPLRPEVSILYDEPLDKKIKLNLENSIKEWLNSYIELTLKEIFSLTESRDMQPGAKGIAYRLTEELGLIKRDKIEEEIKDCLNKNREKRNQGLRKQLMKKIDIHEYLLNKDYHLDQWQFHLIFQ